MQESIHNMARNDARRNQRMEEHLATVFRTTWDDLPPGPAEEERQDTDLGWWSIDPRARARRPRLVSVTTLGGSNPLLTRLVAHAYILSIHAQP